MTKLYLGQTIKININSEMYCVGKIIGICDTSSEIIFRIDKRFEYKWPKVFDANLISNPLVFNIEDFKFIDKIRNLSGLCGFLYYYPYDTQNYIQNFNYDAGRICKKVSR